MHLPGKEDGLYELDWVPNLNLGFQSQSVKLPISSHKCSEVKKKAENEVNINWNTEAKALHVTCTPVYLPPLSACKAALLWKDKWCIFVVWIDTNWMESWKWKPGWSGWNKLKDFDTGSSSVSAGLCDWLCHNNQILLRIRLSRAARLLWLCPALSSNTSECRVESCWYSRRCRLPDSVQSVLLNINQCAIMKLQLQ